MRDTVTGELDMRRFEETGADHVAQSVVFLVEDEDGSRRDT